MDTPLPHHFDPTLFHPPHPHSTLISQNGLDPLDSFPFDPQLENQPDLHQLQQRNPFDNSPFESRPTQPQPRFHEVRPIAPPPTTQQLNHFNQAGQFGLLPRSTPQKNDDSNRGGQLFGVLTPRSLASNTPQSHNETLGSLQNEIDLRPVPITDGGTTKGHFSNMKTVPNPPNIDEWRQRLFNVDESIALTEDQLAPFTPLGASSS